MDELEIDIAAINKKARLLIKKEQEKKIFNAIKQSLKEMNEAGFSSVVISDFYKEECSLDISAATIRKFVKEIEDSEKKKKNKKEKSKDKHNTSDEETETTNTKADDELDDSNVNTNSEEEKEIAHTENDSSFYHQNNEDYNTQESAQNYSQNTH